MPILVPELPPHLATRKRSLDNTRSPDSRSQKRRVDFSSPISNGSSIPKFLNVEMRSESQSEVKNTDMTSSMISTSNSEQSRIRLSPSESDVPINVQTNFSSYSGDYSPRAPRNIQHTTKPSKRRIFGPMPPTPSAHAELLSYNHINPDSISLADETSSSDDDYGPSLPSDPCPNLSEAQNPADNASEQYSNCSSSAPKLQRADWMLTPPSNSDWNSRIDPTKIKSRKFASSKSAKEAADRSGVSSIWTENFEQKRQRLANEVLGRKELPTTTSSSSSRLSNMTQGLQGNLKDTETDRCVKQYNQKIRNKSLHEERQGAQWRGELEIKDQDDPSKRAFDREKDMALVRQMDATQTKKLLSRATDFNSRFQKGSYL